MTIEISPSSNCALFILILHSIWHVRNLKLHQQNNWSPRQTLLYINRIHNKINHSLSALNRINTPLPKQSQVTTTKVPNAHLLSSSSCTFFFIHRTKGCLIVISLTTIHGHWKVINIWRNVHKWKKLHFFFWTLKDYLNSNAHSNQHVDHIILQQEGFSRWIKKKCLPPPEIRIIINDINHLLPNSTDLLLGGIISHNTLRLILDYLPHNFFNLGTFFSFAF